MKMHPILRRTWAIALGVALSLVVALVQISGWHPSLTEPPFPTALEWWMGRWAAPILWARMLPILIPIDLVLLALIGSHPIRPRWWTAVLTVIGLIAWSVLGYFANSISV